MKYKNLPIVKVDSCKSTQDEAQRGLTQLKNPEHKIFWFQSLKQSHGRGRQGHKWVDNQTEALLISASFLWPKNTKFSPHLTLIAGLSLWNSLRQFKKDSRICIKWPNDIVAIENNSIYKIGGILSEARGRLITIGWGINLKGKAPLKKAKVLSQYFAAKTPKDIALAKSLRKEFVSNLNRITKANSWNEFHLKLESKAMAPLWGKRIYVLKKYKGIAIGLDKSGALLLKKSDNEIHKII
jgi:biotin-[acetyl-CoA-carboxylase] ligase BirA-like protein